MSTISLHDIDMSIDPQKPRIRDLRLAELLGFERPRNIRKLIQRCENALKSFGGLVCSTVEPTSKGGRPSKEYYLNERQALYLCTKSEAPNAVDITIQMVEVFHAVKTGRFQSNPTISLDCIVVPKAEWARLQAMQTRWKRFVEDIEKQTVLLRKTVMREGFGLPVEDQPGLPNKPNPKQYSGLVGALHAKGWTLRRFAEVNGWHPGTVSNALAHKSNSQIARQIRRAAQDFVEAA